MLRSSPWLHPHPKASLEYWFFKTNAGEVALLVDWIVRRRAQTAHLRLSVHTPHYRAVLWGAPSAPTANTFLTPKHTVGQIDAVAWDLAITDHATHITPDIFPARHWAMPDLVLSSAPLATFSGWIAVGPTRYALNAAPGLVSHYWGRQLNPDWWWVSANQFDRSGVAVECAVLHTGVWGMPLNLPLGYLYLRQPNGSALWMSPPARVRVSGTPAAFSIQFKPWAAPAITLQATGRDYGDFGENIHNTLVGDLAVWVGDQRLAQAHGTAGLEHRS